MADLNGEMTVTFREGEPDLRDLFASKALPMLIDIGHDEGWCVSETAETAYQYADAMLAARVATGGSGSNQ